MDKLAKVKAEVVRLHNLLPVMDGDNISVNYADRICTTLEMYIDTMQGEQVDYGKLKTSLDNALSKETKESWDKFLQEEPVSEDLEEAAYKYACKCQPLRTDYGYTSPNPEVKEAVLYGAQWQKAKDESTTEDLGEYINELSKQFQEVSFAKLSRIAVRVAKWQKAQFEKNRLKHCNSITNEQAELEQGFIDQHLDKYNRMPTFLDAIEYGMRLKKEQMMAKAIEAHVNYAWSSLCFGGFDWSKTGLGIGDKCKLIIIKEEEYEMGI